MESELLVERLLELAVAARDGVAESELAFCFEGESPKRFVEVVDRKRVFCEVECSACVAGLEAGGGCGFEKRGVGSAQAPECSFCPRVVRSGKGLAAEECERGLEEPDPLHWVACMVCLREKRFEFRGVDAHEVRVELVAVALVLEAVAEEPACDACCLVETLAASFRVDLGPERFEDFVASGSLWVESEVGDELECRGSACASAVFASGDCERPENAYLRPHALVHACRTSCSGWLVGVPRLSLFRVEGELGERAGGSDRDRRGLRPT